MINKQNAVKLITTVSKSEKMAPTDKTKRSIMTKAVPIIDELKDLPGYDALGDVRQSCLVAIMYFDDKADVSELITKPFDKGAKDIEKLKVYGASTIACQWRTNRPNCAGCGCGQ